MRTRGRATILAVVALVGPAIGLSLAGRVTPLRAATEPWAALGLTRLTPPVDARDFTVPKLGGGTLSLAAYRGQVVFLNFWATWCGPCRVEMPAMERLHARFRGSGLAVLAVSVDADADAEPVRLFVRERQLTFPIGLDRKMRVVGLFGVTGLPATLVVDRQGRIVARALGAREWDDPEAVALFEGLLSPK
jgi:peroxiredoxin